MFNRKGQKGMEGLVGLAVIAVAVVIIGSQFGLFSGSSTPATGGTGGATGSTVNVNANTCADSAAVIIGNAVDKFTPTTSYTGDFHRVLLNDQDLGLFKDGTSKTFSKGDKLAIYTAFNGTQVYSKEMKFEVGCDGAYTASALPANIEVTGVDGRDAFKLVANAASTGNTITFYDENGNPMSATANKQALAPGQSKSLKLRFEAPSKQGFSPGRKIMSVCDVNKSLFADLNGLDGLVETTAIPQQHARVAGIGLTASGDYVSYGFEFSGVQDNGLYDGRIQFVVDSTNNPGEDANVTCTFYDQDYYKHSITGNIALGYETDLRVDVAAASPTQTWRFS